MRKKNTVLKHFEKSSLYNLSRENKHAFLSSNLFAILLGNNEIKQKKHILKIQMNTHRIS